MIGLIIPAVIDLVILAVFPPLLMPFTAIGLLLLARAHRGGTALSRASRAALLGLGMLLVLAFLLAAAVPLETSDRVDGYRIFGVLAYVLVGAGWVVFGTTLARTERRRTSLD